MLDTYDFKAYRVAGGKAVEILVSLHRDYIIIDGIKRTWHQARELFASNATPRELADARRQNGGT